MKGVKTLANNYQQSFEKYGQAFGVSPQVLSNIAALESSYNPTAINLWDSNAAKGTPSYGMMQFIEPTFESFYPQAAAARPDLFRELGAKNWKDPQQQIATTAWALSQGLGGHWATYDKASKGTVSPSQGFSAPSGVDPRGLAYARLKALRGGAGEPLLKKIGLAQQMIGQQTGLPQASGGDLSVFGEGGRESYKPLFNHLQGKFGIRLDPGTGQTTGGRHVADSLHYDGRAFDIGSALNAAQLPSIWDYLTKNRGRFGITELLWEDRGTGNEHIHVGL